MCKCRSLKNSSGHAAQSTRSDPPVNVFSSARVWIVLCPLQGRDTWCVARPFVKLVDGSRHKFFLEYSNPFVGDLQNTRDEDGSSKPRVVRPS